MRYEILDEDDEKLPPIYHSWQLSAAKHYVDIHIGYKIWDKKLKRIIYPEREDENRR